MSNMTDSHATSAEDLALAAHLRETLRAIRKEKLPMTYKALTKQLDLRPPHSIHRLTTALEVTMREDVANGVPMIAALVTSRWRGGVPAPGFFALAAALGRQAGTADEIFYRRELEAAIAHWLAPGK